MPSSVHLLLSLFLLSKASFKSLARISRLTGLSFSSSSSKSLIVFAFDFFRPSSLTFSSLAISSSPFLAFRVDSCCSLAFLSSPSLALRATVCDSLAVSSSSALAWRADWCCVLVSSSSMFFLCRYSAYYSMVVSFYRSVASFVLTSSSRSPTL